MNEDHSYKIHWAWIVLASSFITLFINYSIRIGAYSILLPKMIQDLHINLTQAGMIRAAYFFTYILFSPLMGWLTDRIGARWVISFFCLFLGIGTFLMGQASGLLTAILFHTIVGIGASAMWTPTVVMIQKWFGATKRGLALGILSSSYALGYGQMGIILPLIVLPTKESQHLAGVESKIFGIILQKSLGVNAGRENAPVTFFYGLQKPGMNFNRLENFFVGEVFFLPGLFQNRADGLHLVLSIQVRPLLDNPNPKSTRKAGMSAGE